MKLNRGEPDHPHWKTPFTPQEKAMASLGIGCCFLLLAMADWFDPSKPPFTGRWGWLKSAAYEAFGLHGAVVLYCVIGAAFVIAGCVKWLQGRTPRIR
jgi:hypothetical protein